MERAVILNCVSPKIAISMTYRNSALDVWNNLQERFSQGNGPRVFQLQKDLAGIVVFVLRPYTTGRFTLVLISRVSLTCLAHVLVSYASC